MAVDQPAAPRRHDDQLDAIVFAEQLVMLVLRNRQITEPGHQCRAESGLGAADEHHPARESDRLVGAGEALRPYHRPILHRSSRATTKAASGKQNMFRRIAGATETKRTGAP